MSHMLCKTCSLIRDNNHKNEKYFIIIAIYTSMIKGN